MGITERDPRDEAAERVAEALWPTRYMGDLSRAEWQRCYGVVDAANDQLRGAVEALESIRNRLRPFVKGGEPAAEDAVDIYEIVDYALDRLGGQSDEKKGRAPARAPGP